MQHHQIDPVLGYAIGNRLHGNNLNDKQNANLIAAADNGCSHVECYAHKHHAAANSISINCYVHRTNICSFVHSFIHSSNAMKSCTANMWKIYAYVRMRVCMIDALDRQQIANKTRNKVISSFFRSIALRIALHSAACAAAAAAANNIAPITWLPSNKLPKKCLAWKRRAHCQRYNGQSIGQPTGRPSRLSANQYSMHITFWGRSRPQFICMKIDEN